MKKIVLTRAFELNWEDQQFFQKMGYQTTILPLTKINFLPISENQELLTAIKKADWLFFTSQTPVARILPLISSKVKIAVIGEKTAEAVRKMDVSVDFISKVARKEAFIKEWLQAVPMQQRIFYPKSQLADTLLEERLGEQHRVDSFVVYENIFPKTAEEELKKLFIANQIEGVYLTSPSSWARFLKVYQHYPDRKIDLFVIGETTRNAVKQSGYSAHLITDIK